MIRIVWYRSWLDDVVSVLNSLDTPGLADTLMFETSYFWSFESSSLYGSRVTRSR